MCEPGVVASASPAPTTTERTDERLDLTPANSLDTPWRAIVWNDPVNLMSYVVYVFRSYFGFSEQKATKLMLQVHQEGKAVVATGAREVMEQHAAAMHSYGLSATVDRIEQ